jgi:hypothetical protein
MMLAPVKNPPPGPGGGQATEAAPADAGSEAPERAEATAS